MTGPAIPITGDIAADMLLQDEPLALLIGMLLDQQVPMEWAFRGPATLKERLGGSLDAAQIAAMSEDDVVAVCCQKPAVHRFPAAMGRRIHALCLDLVEHFLPGAVAEGEHRHDRTYADHHAQQGEQGAKGVCLQRPQRPRRSSTPAIPPGC